MSEKLKIYRVKKTRDASIIMETDIFAKDSNDAVKIAEETPHENWLHAYVTGYDDTVVHKEDCDEIQADELLNTPDEDGMYLIPIPAKIHLKVKASSLEDANLKVERIRSIAIDQDLALDIKINGPHEISDFKFNGVEKEDYN